MRQFAKRRNETLRKGAMFDFSVGSECNKLWELKPRTSSTEPLLASGFQERDYDDVFGVLMSLGAFCDCEILYDEAEEVNRLKSRYWKTRHSTLVQSDSQMS